MYYRTSTCSLAPLTPLCTDACTLTSTFSPAPLCCHQSLCPIVVHACSRNLGPFLPISPHVCHTAVPSYIMLMWCNNWLPGDGIGPEASRLRLSHWAGPSVTRSAKLSQSFYGGIIIVILTKGKPVPLAWEFIYKLGEVTRVTSTILPDMGRKCVTEA